MGCSNSTFSDDWTGTAIGGVVMGKGDEIGWHVLKVGVVVRVADKMGGCVCKIVGAVDVSEGEDNAEGWVDKTVRGAVEDNDKVK